mgnify:CR=1 FL=1
MKNRDWKEARGHVQRNHTVRPGHVREQARRHGAREGRADRQRDARRFRRTRSPTPRDTGVPADGRRIGPATTSGADRQGRQARAQGAEIEGRPVRVRGDRTLPQTRESVEEALIDMYLAGVSTRQVDDTGQLLWGDRMPSRTLSGKLKRVYAEIDEWRTRPLDDEYPYVFVDGVWHKRSRGESMENVSILVAIGVSKDGHREAVGVAEGMREDSASWEQFFRGMVERGLKGVRLVVGDRCAGLVATVESMLAEGGVPAMHGALLAQRALQGAAQPPRMDVGGPEGRVRRGVPGIRVGQGRDRRRGDRGREAEGRRQLPAGGDRRDHGLPAAGVPGRAPRAHPRERHDRTAQPRDPPAHARRGKLPGREQRAHARLRAHQVRHREEWSNRRYLDMSRLDDNLQEAN